MPFSSAGKTQQPVEEGATANPEEVPPQSSSSHLYPLVAEEGGAGNAEETEDQQASLQTAAAAR